MTPLYQAVTAADDEAYIELAKLRLERTYSTKRFRRQLITYCLLVIVYYIINGSLLATLLVSLVLFAASLWSYIGIRRPAVMDKKSRALAEEMIKKAEESNARLETRYDFYQDMMNWENSHARGSMEYSDISEITEYSRHYILVTTDQRVLFFWKDKFVIGSPMEFMAFIQERQR